MASQKKIFLKWHWAPPTVIRFRYSSGVGRGGPGRKFPAIEFEDRFRKYDLFTFRWLGTVADVLAAVRRATGAFMKAEYAPPRGGYPTEHQAVSQLASSLISPLFTTCTR